MIFEDHATQSVRWADVRIDDRKQLSIGEVQSVPAFKTLDASRQKLVQMREVEGLLLVGVRDDDDGKFESGWVLMDVGVDYHDHGDHGHWSFKTPPSVRASRLDKQQGNPAHVYLYDRRFFVANDKLEGYTRIDPADFGEVSEDVAPTQEARFLKGGGNHITLAVVDDRVGYSCWIDRDGPNKGRVDVTAVAAANAEPAYSFTLPSGGIHGAVANSGRVFFAPSDGLCWVAADPDASAKAAEVKVHHVSLGQADDKPRRTGAFVSHGRHVLFVTGKGPDTQLAVLDAAAEIPTATLRSLNVKAGSKALTPTITTNATGQALAFVFHDHNAGVEMQDTLDVFSLDPNGDGDLADLKLLKSLNVGPSAVEGHSGHHGIAFDSERQFGFITNPGDGTISVLSLAACEITETFRVGGKPTAIVARGGRQVND